MRKKQFLNSRKKRWLNSILSIQPRLTHWYLFVKAFFPPHSQQEAPVYIHPAAMEKCSSCLVRFVCWDCFQLLKAIWATFAVEEQHTWWFLHTPAPITLDKPFRYLNKVGWFKVQGFFICHIINYTGYNQKWNVDQIRSAQWTVQRIQII